MPARSRVVVPVVELRRSQQHPERAQREPHVAVDEDGPDAPEGDEAGDELEREAEHERRQVLEGHGPEPIERVLPIGGEEVEALCGVVDAVEAPEERHPVGEPVPPVDDDVADQDHRDDLGPEGPARDGLAQPGRDEAVEQRREPRQRGQRRRAPDGLLHREEEEVRPRFVTPEGLLPPGEEALERDEDDREEGQGERRPEHHRHGSSPWVASRSSSGAIMALLVEKKTRSRRGPASSGGGGTRTGGSGSSSSGAIMALLVEK